jgi:hypothetical protein
MLAHKNTAIWRKPCHYMRAAAAMQEFFQKIFGFFGKTFV